MAKYKCTAGYSSCEGSNGITGNFWHPMLPFDSSREELVLIGSIVQAYASSAFWLTRMYDLCSQKPRKSFGRNESLSQQIVETIAKRVLETSELPDVIGSWNVSPQKAVMTKSMTIISCNWKRARDIRNLLAHGVLHQLENGGFRISRCRHCGLSLDSETLTKEMATASEFLLACNEILMNYLIIHPLVRQQHQ